VKQYLHSLPADNLASLMMVRGCSLKSNTEKYRAAIIGEQLMAAYVIFTREKTVAPAELELYRQKAPVAEKGHQITPIAFYGNFEVLEGAEIEGAGTLSFPSMEEARAWYRSAAYQQARAHRRLGSDYRILIVEGV
jgi:uncharacterized protein (DUF1330 family)